MRLPSQDFESCASAGSATAADIVIKSSIKISYLLTCIYYAGNSSQRRSQGRKHFLD